MNKILTQLKQWIQSLYLKLKNALTKKPTAVTTTPPVVSTPAPAPADKPADFGPPPPPVTGGTDITDLLFGKPPATPTPPAVVTEIDDDTQRPETLDNSYAQKNTVFVGHKTLTGPGKVKVFINVTSKLGGTQLPTVVSIGPVSTVMTTESFDPVDVDTPVVVSASSPVVMKFQPV